MLMTSEMEVILKKGRELHLAMIDGDRPYLVPLNYGYAEGSIYIHSGREGRKLDCLRRNPQVCFTVNEVLERVGGHSACQWSTRFRSLIAEGTARIIDDRQQKIAGYDVIMQHFGGPQGNYKEKYLIGSLIIRIAIESLSVKYSEESDEQTAN